MDTMDEDFITEHVLPSRHRSNPINAFLLEDFNPSRHAHFSHAFASNSSESETDMTLNALHEHLELTSRFYNNPLLSDVRLRVGKEIYFAHKFLLAKSSDVLATLLYSQHWTLNQSEILLEEQEECQGEVFEKFLKFFYTAKVNLNESMVIGLLCLADKYNVQALRHLCAQFMIIKAKPPHVRNGIAWYPIAKQFSLENLRDACMKTVAWNMEHLLSSEYQTDWLRCDFDFVSDLLSSSSLVVSHEYRLYLSLTDWLRAHSTDAEKSSYAHELLPLIRFPQMLPIQLHQIEQSPFYQSNPNEQTRQLLQRLLYQAYRFHTLAVLKRDSDKPEFFPLDWYLPREYTEMNITDRVDIQSTLRFGIQVDVQTCSSPVPSTDRTADWKVVYRKRSHDKWTLKVHRHDEVTETYAQVTAIIYDADRRVLQVEDGDTFTFTAANQYELEIALNDPYNAKELYLLIKPVIV